MGWFSSCPAQLLFLLIALSTVGPGQGKARFLSHVPYDADVPEVHNNHDTEENIHDSIVKLPGRHYPKLSYTPGGFPDPFVGPFFPSKSCELNSRINSLQRVKSGITSHETRIYPSSSPDLDASKNHQHDDDARLSGTTFISSSTDGSLEQNDGSVPDKTTISTPITTASSGPHFDRSMEREVAVMRGRSAVLNCRVLDLQGKTVSWIRSSNLAILSIGEYRYSTDRRMSVTHSHRTGEWSLRIDGVTHRDEGAYECQVSTAPPLTWVVHLRVTDSPPLSSVHLSDARVQTALLGAAPRAVIVGGPTIVVPLASALSLTCLITHSAHSAHPPVLVDWYHQDQLLSRSSGGYHRRQDERPADPGSGSEGLGLYATLGSSAKRPQQHYSFDYPAEDLRDRLPSLHKQGGPGVHYSKKGGSASDSPEVGGAAAPPEYNTSVSLLVGAATLERAGKYTCRPHGGREASATVLVVAGPSELTATDGTLTGGAASAAVTPSAALLLLLLATLRVLTAALQESGVYSRHML